LETAEGFVFGLSDKHERIAFARESTPESDLPWPLGDHLSSDLPEALFAALVSQQTSRFAGETSFREAVGFLRSALMYIDIGGVWFCGLKFSPGHIKRLTFK
jgi:hypothetical protein